MSIALIAALFAVFVGLLTTFIALMAARAKRAPGRHEANNNAASDGGGSSQTLDGCASNDTSGSCGGDGGGGSGD